MERAESRDKLAVARLVFVGLMSAEVVVLAATGLWLAFYYRPSPTSSWTSIQALRSGVTSADAMRGVHRLTAFAALPTSLVTAVLVVADSRVRRPGWRQGRLAIAAGPGLVVLVVAATFTGYLLPWDQLALWAVSVGTNMHGYGPLRAACEVRPDGRCGGRQGDSVEMVRHPRRGSLRPAGGRARGRLATPPP